MYPISLNQPNVAFASSAVTSPMMSITQSNELPASMQLSLRDFSTDPMLSFARISSPKKAMHSHFDQASVSLFDFDADYHLVSTDLASMDFVSLIDEVSISNLNEQANLPYSDAFASFNFEPFTNTELEVQVQQQMDLSESSKEPMNAWLTTQGAGVTINSWQIDTEMEVEIESENTFYEAPPILHSAEAMCFGGSCTQVTQEQIQTLRNQLELCIRESGFTLGYYRQKLCALIHYYAKNYHQEGSKDKKKLIMVGRKALDIRLVEYWSFAYLHGGLPLLRAACHHRSSEGKKPFLLNETQLLELYSTLLKDTKFTFAKLAKKYELPLSTLKDIISRMGLFRPSGQKKLVFKDDPSVFPKLKRELKKQLNKSPYLIRR